MMLFAAISLAAAVQANTEFFNPSRKGYESTSEAENGCAEKNGEIAGADMAGLEEFIQNDSLLKRKNVLILAMNGESTYVFSKKLHKEAKPKKKSLTICVKVVSGRELDTTTCATSGPKDLYPNDYAFFPAQTATTVNWHEARAECQKLGSTWDLAIINNNEEFFFIDNVIKDECWADQAFWLGMNEYDTKTNDDFTTSEGNVKTMFGRIPDWKIHWGATEPNDNLGTEECLRMKDRTVNDALCDRTWTGAANTGVGMGYVCEHHNFYENCQKQDIEDDPKYSVTLQGSKTWLESRDECQAMGAGWDLAVPNDEAEMTHLSEMVQCDDGGIWLGVTWTPETGTSEWNSNGTFWSVDGDASPYIPWDKHTNWDKPNPNTKDENVKECIRMRGNLVTDAMCDKTSGPNRRPWPQPWGWICEYNAPSCVANATAEPLEDGEYVIRHDQGLNWSKARQQCKSIGKDWDLVIFNHKREYQRITQIIKDHCVDDFAYWVGYRENDRVARTALNAPLLSHKDGFTTSIDLPWDLTSNPTSPEPNDWLGSEECVRMKGGEMNDAICSRTWSGAKKAGKNMGYICERHHPCEAARSGTTFTGYDGPDYKIVAPYLNNSPQYNSATDAKTACKAYGTGWDLVVIDDGKELKEINDKITDGCTPYWTGMTEHRGKLYDLDGKTEVAFTNWDHHLSHGFGFQPNFPYDDDYECVRMRGGMYNDAACDDETGFTKQEGMGYICEYKPPAPTPDPTDPDDDQCLPCRHNPGVLPWVTHHGCVDPYCGAKLGIVDAWKIGNGVDRPVRYGFIGLIKIPEEVIDGNHDFSVLIRFSKRVTHGHFQLWNMKFFNFYNGGYEVLIHSKFWNTDRHDKYSVGFVAEELNAEEYPELLFWDGRQMKHHCFQPSMHHSGVMRNGRNQQTDYDRAVDEKSTEIDPDDITSVKWKKGKIVYVRGNRRYKNSKMRK